MKKVTYFGLLLAVALTGLSSCSSSDDVTSDPTNTKSGESRLTLTISTGDKNATTGNAKANSFNMGTRTTDIIADPGTEKELQINHITVGIFNSDGSTVRTIQELENGTAEAGNGKYSYSYTVSQDAAKATATATATATIVTNSLEAGDVILVACNAPAGTFNGVQTAAQFRAKTETIDNALATEFGMNVGAAIVDHNIPMFGEATLSKNDNDDNFHAGVTVLHQTAKVTLESLKVDFDQNGAYKDATFEPTGIFLMNVPETLNFTTAAATTTASTASSSLFQGHDASTTATYREYLATKPITGTPLSGDAAATTSNTFGSRYYFYTMPNSLDDKDKRTKLVIMGEFRSNGSDKATTVYYPVSLNANYDKNGVAQAVDGGKTFTVNPNMNYKCKVTIKTKGALSPTDDITPQQATITVTVQPFAGFEQNTVFE